MRILAENNVLILISNYEKVYSNKQKENMQKLIWLLDKYNCQYYNAKFFDWTDLGTPLKHDRTDEELERVYSTCFIRDCAAFFEGKLYRCCRSYVLEKMGLQAPIENEVIDFNCEYSKDEIMYKIQQFYSNNKLKACDFCNSSDLRNKIESAIQII